MSNKEKLELLKKYKKALIYVAGYEAKEEQELKEKEIEEPQKVLVLKRKWYGKDLKAS